MVRVVESNGSFVSGCFVVYNNYIYIHVYITQMVPVVCTVKRDVRGLTIVHDVTTKQHITQGGLLTVLQLQHQLLCSHAVPPEPPGSGTEGAPRPCRPFRF